MRNPTTQPPCSSSGMENAIGRLSLAVAVRLRRCAHVYTKIGPACVLGQRSGGGPRRAACNEEEPRAPSKQVHCPHRADLWDVAV